MPLHVLLALLLGALIPPTLIAAEEPPDIRTASKHVPRVRAADSRVRTALAEGRMRSASFRAVLERVEQLDVIAYIETQPHLRSRLAGRMTWVIATREFRYVRVSLNPDLPADLLIASLAHELQHVVEVGEQPSIVDIETLTTYYQSAGTDRHPKNDEWDTVAAQRMGDTVRRELSVAALLTSGRVAESIQPRRLDAHR